ncbi:hypothetical protein ABIB57_003624 [Devosia sp. UYZn731]|uniref:hypothetical protein n=1 Tax=Devosia sp. UYZn731 TaxID=3156345 RepID=UPI00339B9236
MNGFSIEGGRIVIDYGSRRVATTGGTLLQFLTGAQSFSTSIGFPDANKVPLYQWLGTIQRAVGDNFLAHREARPLVGARPQEWGNTIILGAAPAGADLFIGQATLVRTAAPSHTWLGTPIAPVIPQGVAIQLTGSMLVEMTVGITRGLTVDIVGGNLVALLQHSVGPAAGNFTTSGEVPLDYPSVSSSPGNLHQGAENNAPSGAAIPVWWSSLVQGTQSFSGSISGGPNARAYANASRYGGSAQVGYSDPTNYASTYSLVVNGRFGRRS